MKYIDFTTFQEGVALYLKTNFQKNKIFLEQLEQNWNEQEMLFFYYFKMMVYEKQILEKEKVSGTLFWKFVEFIFQFSHVHVDIHIRLYSLDFSFS